MMSARYMYIPSEAICNPVFEQVHGNIAECVKVVAKFYDIYFIA